MNNSKDNNKINLEDVDLSVTADNDDTELSEDIEMVNLTFEDGSTSNYEIIAKFDVDDITYVALLPEDDEEDSDVIVYRYVEDGNDVELNEITDEDEFNRVADVLDEILDDLEFNSED